MRNKARIQELIKTNVNKIAKVFADEFYFNSLDLVQEEYISYTDNIIENPQLSKCNKIPFKKFNCVYFLLSDDVVVYVGQTTHLSARVAQHVVDSKDFNYVSWFEVDRDTMLLTEAFNITYHNPVLNKEKPKTLELLLMIAKKVR